METDTKEMLEEQIQKELAELQNLETGSEEHVKACESISKLCKVLLEQTRDEAAFEEIVDREDLESKRFNLDKIYKEQEAAEARKDRLIRYGIDIGGIVLPLIVYTGLIKTGFKFEETGTVTSSFFRNLINQVKPKR